MSDVLLIKISVFKEDIILMRLSMIPSIKIPLQFSSFILVYKIVCGYSDYKWNSHIFDHSGAKFKQVKWNKQGQQVFD